MAVTCKKVGLFTELAAGRQTAMLSYVLAASGQFAGSVIFGDLITVLAPVVRRDPVVFFTALTNTC